VKELSAIEALSGAAPSACHAATRSPVSRPRSAAVATTASGDGGQGSPGHRGDEGLRRVLNQDRAPREVDRRGTDGTVVQRAGQDDGDHVRAVPAGGGAQERVDGGSVPVLPRSGAQRDGPVLDEQVQVGHGYADPPGGELLMVGRGLYRQGSGPGQHPR